MSVVEASQSLIVCYGSWSRLRPPVLWMLWGYGRIEQLDMMYKAKKFYCFVLYRKSWLTLM